MHCFIYEVSEKPIREDERISIQMLPDWFTLTVADTVSDLYGEERDDAIEDFTSSLEIRHGSNDDGFTINDGVRRTWFGSKFRKFNYAVARLSDIPFSVFCNTADAQRRNVSGIDPYKGFIKAVDELKLAVDDKYGNYIYDAAKCGLVTFDEWIREHAGGAKFYFGGVIDYHC